MPAGSRHRFLKEADAHTVAYASVRAPFPYLRNRPISLTRRRAETRTSSSPARRARKTETLIYATRRASPESTVYRLLSESQIARPCRAAIRRKWLTQDYKRSLA